MRRTDVLIVGGGPAGAACAWALKRQNVECLILDKARFPRPKLCAGWVQPEVWRSLDMTPDAYPHGLMRFGGLRVSIRGVRVDIPTRQYAIRRFEFDDWLLQRSGVPVVEHHVRYIEECGDVYIVDGEYSSRYLVGAGGTYCPVYRTLFQDAHPRDKKGLIVTLEDEFPYPWKDKHCYLWFMENGLPGYAWYVPKAGDYVTIGLGGKAELLAERSDHIQRHWDLLIRKLERMGLVVGGARDPKGYAYYLRQSGESVRRGNAFLVGDAAGLATLDMGEGIHPAIQSGIRAASAIARAAPYTLEDIQSHSFFPRIWKTISWLSAGARRR